MCQMKFMMRIVVLYLMSVVPENDSYVIKEKGQIFT